MVAQPEFRFNPNVNGAIQYLLRLDQWDSVWIEAVEDLETAYDRMRDWAAKRPGKCFVYCTRTRRAVHRSDTAPDEKEFSVSI
jgi:hypothetical protein